MQVLRGTAAAPLAQLVDAWEISLRLAAGMGGWRLVSPGPSGGVTGIVNVVDSLTSFAGSSSPTILVLKAVGGEEDMPQVTFPVFGNEPFAFDLRLQHVRSLGERGSAQGCA